MTTRAVVLGLFFLAAVPRLSGHVLHVPAEYARIQLAINAAVNGDTVVVEPGTYYENVIFRGKRILLTSRYYETNNVSFISSTIINGSTPIFSDTASCVLFINGEDSTAILQGFTLTQGRGTAWSDEHGAGIYREGGGVLTAFSSPTVRNNFIVANTATDAATLSSGGGGGLRCGDGTPHILNNVIMSNKGMYGGGIVLNYCDGALIRNNIIYLNSVDRYSAGKPTYGGGGIWINDKLSPVAKPHIIENNSIILNSVLDVGASPAGTGGGILIYNLGSATIRNNIVWENHFTAGGPITVLTGAVTMTYNDVMATTAGTGNININPALGDSSFLLSPASPCVDAGDPDLSFNDVENSGSPGNALFPSRGVLRNDIGAYGGKHAAPFVNFNWPSLFIPVTSADFGYIPPLGQLHALNITYWNYGTKTLIIDSIRLRGTVVSGVSLTPSGSRQVGSIVADTITLSWAPAQTLMLNDTLLIYHHDSAQVSPARIVITGKSFAMVLPSSGVMYAFSGLSDGGRMFSVDTAHATVSLKGSTGFTDVLSARINPATNELVALASGATTQLIRVSSDSGFNATLSTVALTNPKGMAFGADSTLYIGVLVGDIYSVDIATGKATAAASTGLAISGLAFNPVDGSLWVSVRPKSVGKDNIYTVNLATGTSTLIGATGFKMPTRDITFDKKGRLFGVIDSGTAKESYLISINTTNGAATVIGGMGVNGIETIELNSHYPTAVHVLSAQAPEAFALEQNFPNPFNPTTDLRYSIAGREHVIMKVYDALGRLVTTLVDENKPAGTYQVRFNALGFSSGVYFYRLQAGRFAETKKMIIMK